MDIGIVGRRTNRQSISAPSVSPAHIAQSARADAPSLSVTSAHLPDSSHGNDPRDALPSSPPQIYLNMLILESSLRLQYLSLRARLRLHLLLLTVLSAWIAAFTYLLFFRPREDGSGVGGSVYWVVESAEKLGWCGGIVTLCLFWGTGLYERGVRWPRKFVSTTNRGLRGFNMKVVVTKGSMLREMVGWLSMLDPLGWFREERVNFQILPKDIEIGAARENWKLHTARHGLIEEDIAPSGDVLKLLLLPKPFSPDFREGWETYRMEYWEKENARRSELRKVLTARLREVMRSKGGWLNWLGWRRLEVSRMFSSKSRREMDLERLAISEKEDRFKEKHRREGQLRAASHSRSSSRSSTPGDGDSRPGTADGLRTQKIRRGSSAASTTRRPHKRSGSLQLSRLSATETLLNDEPAKRASFVSVDSDLGEVDEMQVKKEESDNLMPSYTNEIKAEPDEEPSS
nr:sporulation-specific protein spo7 [Quercus suber]